MTKTKELAEQTANTMCCTTVNERIVAKLAFEYGSDRMLARICDWLKDYDITKHIGVIYFDACSVNFDKQALIDKLRKAMEE